MADDNNENENERRAKEYFKDGLKKMRAGDYEGAIVDYTKAIELNPKFADTHNNRGVAKIQQGKIQKDLQDALVYFESALADFNEAIRLQLTDAEAYANRGSVKFILGGIQKDLHDALVYFEGAVADFNEAIRLKHDFVGAYNGRGRVKFELGKRQRDLQAALAYFDEAIADYDETLKLDPDNQEAINNQKLVLLQKEREKYVERHGADTEMLDKQYKHYRDRAERGRKRIAWAWMGLFGLIILLIVGIVILYFYKFITVKEAFDLLPWLSMVGVIIFTAIWGLRWYAHQVDKDEILAQDFWRRAYVERYVIKSYIAEESQELQQAVFAEYAWNWSRNSPTEILLAVKNKQVDSAKLHPMDILADKIGKIASKTSGGGSGG